MAYFYIKEREKVLHNNKECIILRIDNLNEVTIQEVNSNKIYTVSISNLKPLTQNFKNDVYEIENLSEKKWEIAQKRFELIKPLINSKKKKEDVEKIAKSNNISASTIYRWIKLFNENGTVTSILGKEKNGGRGKSRLTIEQDKIINETINLYYLNNSRKSINKTIRKVFEKCLKQNIKLPHSITIRSRIKNIPEEEVIKKRIGPKEAKYKFEPLKGAFPDVPYPYSVIQIDHTKVDVILVDEIHRKPYKRPWLTLAIDIYSRMVVGFYLSFESPGMLGTGMCISNCILPKEIWLEQIGVKAEWPCWGKIHTLHLDNAKEFRSDSLKKSCQNYDINIEYRPVATPHWGGHIERLLGTFSKEIHDLPGTTFSSPILRKNYDSIKNSSLTLLEFEKWLTIYITNIYHNRIHSNLGITPVEKYKIGIFGDEENLGIGIVPKILNERKLRLDFMPIIERTVQEYGVIIDHVTYYHDILRKYIHSKEKNNLKKKFIFRRDPRDISVIFFYDPETKEYYNIPYRDTSLPPISIWEFNDIVRNLKKEKTTINEKLIFEAYRRMEEIELSSIKKTKKIRRFKEIDTNIYADQNIQQQNLDPILTNIDLDIKPFEDIDDETFK